MQVQDVLSAFDNIDDHLATEFYAEVNGYVFSLEKDGEEEDWYIQVKVEDGGHLYDGWWPDSEDKQLNEAVEESLVGSGLLSK